MGVLTCTYILPRVGLYRKIVSYILLRSGLGSPTEIAVVREATGMCSHAFIAVVDAGFLEGEGGSITIMRVNRMRKI